MEFEVKRIADMNRAAYNPRVDLQPEDEEYQAIERSLKRHGLVQLSFGTAAPIPLFPATSV